jgi:hypothetical protein
MRRTPVRTLPDTRLAIKIVSNKELILNQALNCVK